MERNRQDNARPVIDTATGAGQRVGIGTAAAVVAEHLRLVWNARGAADIAKLDSAFPGMSIKSPGPRAQTPRSMTTSGTGFIEVSLYVSSGVGGGASTSIFWTNQTALQAAQKHQINGLGA